REKITRFTRDHKGIALLSTMAVGGFTCFATTAPGVETLLVREAATRGLVARPVESGGVEFDATPAALADALVHLRTANRLTVRVAAFHARTFAELERHAAKVDWSPFVPAGAAVHFRVTSKKSRLYHQDAIAERLERCLRAVDSGSRMVRAAAEAEALERDVTRLPGVQRFVVRIFRDDVTISADASGALLHLRGWRQAVAKAPLRETLAAAVLAGSGWDRTYPLTDPFCGAGTIPIESAQIAAGIPPGAHRCFAAERWASLRGGIDRVRAAARAAERPVTIAIEGSDRDPGAIEAAIANAERAGVANVITFRRAVISDLTPASGAGWVITNPPYGSRIGDPSTLRDLYAAFGRVVRERRPRWSVAMMSGDRALDGQTGFAWEELLKTSNGGIPVRLIRAYPGS
ncbi:MAG: THUMP domain-containing class I SAM-dependent RNA methyltransferase, partial [Gemmatimonadales bacterium]